MEKPTIHPEPITEEEAFRHSDGGGTILTVNRRLARYLAGRFTDAQLGAGKTVWETPDIVPYAAWLERGYDRALYAGRTGGAKAKRPVLLSPAQELRVWEQIIRESSCGDALLQVPEAAKTAQEAWETCITWRLPFEEMSYAPSEDTRAFLEWAGAFKQRCSSKGWLDRAGLGDFLADLFSSGALKPPEHLVLAGFDEITPQQAGLMDVLASSGCRVHTLAPSELKGDAFRCGFADADAEMAAAARWARSRMEADPAGRIGIVVPGLESVRERLAKALDDVLHPQAALSPPESRSRLYNISLGRPLSAYPVIKSGLMFLQLAVRPLSVDEYSRFLRSPFLAGAETGLSKRAILDACIREHGEVSITTKGLIYHCSAHDRRGGSCPILKAALNRFLSLSTRLPDRQKPSGWAADFSDLLEALGWPGQRPMSSDMHQTVSAWQDALYRFSAMDIVLGETDMAEAIAGLTRICAETTFQPETGDAQVQVMGVLEAAGERFDHLWIMGMQDENWPPSPRSNPLLPVWLQRRLNLPHASPEREFEFARRVTRRLLASSDEVIVSYPLMDGESELYPSPLVASLPIRDLDKITAPPPFEYWNRIRETGCFERLADQKGPGIQKGSHIHGGTGLLKAQAACPFSAYAVYRLGAEELEMPVPGLDARQRGTLVHLALELIWEKLGSMEALAAKPREGLETEIENAASSAVAGMAARYPKKFTKRFTVLEKQRLESLLLEWLEVEKQRRPFTVGGHEKLLQCGIGGITLRTRADRIDRMDDGRLVIIDYKTGDTSARDWFTERIAEPQLPLYSLFVDEPVAAVLFARVKKGDSKYLGIAEEEGIAPGVKAIDAAGGFTEGCASMAEVMDAWRKKLESLAEEVRQGHAAVSPVSIHTSCRYCGLGPLCRINEAEAVKRYEEVSDA